MKEITIHKNHFSIGKSHDDPPNHFKLESLCGEVKINDIYLDDDRGMVIQIDIERKRSLDQMKKPQKHVCFS